MFNSPMADPFEALNVPKRLKRIVWIVTLTISLWLLLYPKPYLFIFIIVSLSIPALLVLAMFLPNGRGKKGSLYNSWNDTRYFILGPLFLVSAAFSLSVLSNNQITENLHSFIILLAFSIISTIIFYLIFKKGIASCFFASLFLSAGLVISINGVLLPDSMNIRKGILMKKHIGYKQSAHFNISSQSQIIILRVSQSTYARTDIGMKVCFIKQNGLLGIEIKDVIDCSVKNND